MTVLAPASVFKPHMGRNSCPLGVVGFDPVVGVLLDAMPRLGKHLLEYPGIGISIIAADVKEAGGHCGPMGKGPASGPGCDVRCSVRRAAGGRRSTSLAAGSRAPWWSVLGSVYTGRLAR